MFVLIEYPAGIIAEAVVLSMGRDETRLAVAGHQDALLLRRFGHEWRTAADEPVVFDFLLSPAPEAEPIALPLPAARARVAGSYAL